MSLMPSAWLSSTARRSICSSFSNTRTTSPCSPFLSSKLYGASDLVSAISITQLCALAEGANARLGENRCCLAGESFHRHP